MSKRKRKADIKMKNKIGTFTFALIIAGLFCGLFLALTDWKWWGCVCAGLLTLWFCLLVFMIISRIVLNSKKNLLKEIERHENLEERLVDDIVSLIELYNYLMPNSHVASPQGTTDKLHRAMEDVNEYMKQH